MKIWRTSLPARVAITTSGLLSLLLFLFTASAYGLTAVLLREGVDMALRAAVPMQSRGGPDMLERAHEFERRDPGARLVQVVDPDGNVQSGSGDLPVDPAALEAARQQRTAFSSVAPAGERRLAVRSGPSWWLAMTPVKGEIRVIYMPTGPRRDAHVLMVGMPLGMMGDVLPQVLRGMILLSLVGVALSGVITWRMAGETYRPLRRIMDIAGSVTTRTLNVRIPEGWHDETLQRLTTVLNAMVGRLQESFEAQGRFVASAAHELRGPLAAMRAELEVTLRRTRTPEEYEQALVGALEETGRLTSLAEHLLILARYERGAGLSMEPDLPLAPLLERVGSEVRRSTGQEVQVSAPADLAVTGDPIALERLVANLARNGVEAGGAPVEIEAGRNQAGVWIAVRDHGPGIDPEAVPMLFEPFYRADAARRRDAGVGLGLSIVKTIVEAHGGQIQVDPAAPGGGARFVVQLPG